MHAAELAALIYVAVVKLRPHWHDEDPNKGFIKIIMTGSASDEANMQKHLYNKQIKKHFLPLKKIGLNCLKILLKNIRALILKWM